MNTNSKIEWSAWEYEHKDQSNDWFWALGVIVVTGALTSLILGNFFFAMLLVIGGGLMGFFAKQKPDMVHYELNDKGLLMKNRLYEYKSIKSFWVQKAGTELNLKPTLFIHTERVFMPIVSMPVEPYHEDKIRDMMLSYGVVEEEIHPPHAEKIMDFLGF